MYHSIANNPRDPHAIHPEAFARQMTDLAQRQTQVLPLVQAIAELRAWRKFGGIAITFDDAYQDFLLNAAPVLKQHGFHATVFTPTGLLGGTAVWDTYDKSKRLMDWDELGEVYRLGFGIGSHTVSHPRLTECDAATLEYELRASLDSLTERFANMTPIISYPGGYFGRREMRAARRAGYMAGVGVASRWANYPWTNPYHLRRQRWKG